MKVSARTCWLAITMCASLFCAPAFSADLTGDGQADILWRQNGTGALTIWKMSGATPVPSAVGNWSVPADWVVLATADFNGDGTPDILWRQLSTGILTIWLMSGGAYQSSSGSWSVPTDWVVQGVGDFNNDGRADILWRQNSTGMTTIWLMGPGTLASSVGAYSIPADWVVQAVADFNGDGIADILWRQNSTGSTAIWLMGSGASAGSIASQVGNFTVPTDWVVRGVGDFDGDGKADILWRQASTGTVAIWLMKPDGTIKSSVGGWVVPTNWIVQEVGDFNKDGKADILWREYSVGTVTIWLMNGGAAPSAPATWSVPVSWGIQAPAPGRVTLAWTDNASSESGFTIERSLDGSTNWTQIGTTASNVTTYQDAGLSPWTTYYYRVKAYSASAQSAYSPTANGVTP